MIASKVDNHMPPTPRGFTLVEMAVVLLVVGLLVVGSLGLLERGIRSRGTTRSLDILDRQRSAAVGFLLTHDRLPGPDRTGDGREDGGAGLGFLPNADLRCPRVDGHQGPVRYDVNNGLTKKQKTNNNSSAETLSEKLARLQGGPKVRVDEGTPFTVACVFISTGYNGRLEANSRGDRVYDVFESIPPPAGYDDRVVYIGPLALVDRLSRSQQNKQTK